MATSISWPPIGGVSYSIPAAGEVGWPNLSNFLIALQNAQGTDAQKWGIRTATTTPVTVAATDCVVKVALTVPAAVAVQLPAGVNGQIYTILDGTGDASSNNITVTPNGSETINGAANLVIAGDNDAYALIFRAGSPGNWSIFSAFSQTFSGTVPRSQIAAGSPDYVVINGNVGQLSEEQYLSQVRGGLGVNASAFSGYVKASAGVFSASAITAADLPTGIDAAKIANGSVSNTEFQYLDGATSNLQAQINAIVGGGITSLTGDVVATGPGAAAATIQAGVIVNSMVSASAAIAYSKLNLTGSIVNADVNASAAIAYSKLNLTGSIVNADINASAAIAYSKLNLSNSIVNADISASAAIALSKLAAQAANTVVANATGSSAVPTAVSLTDAATASTAMFRDANANTRMNNSIDGYTTTATAAGTTVLTVGSTKIQFFTGTTTQTVTLPVVSTLVLGQEFFIVNRSTGTVTINSSGGNLVTTLSGGSAAIITCILITGTSAASWDAFVPGSGGGSGTGVKNYLQTGANSASGWAVSGAGIAVSTESTASNLPDNITQTTGVKILRASGSDYALYRFTMDVADYNWLCAILWDMKYAGTAGDYTLALYTNTASNYGGTYTQVTLPTSSIPATGSNGTKFQTSGLSGGSGTQYMELRINGIAGTTPLYLNNVTFTPNGPAQGAAISDPVSFTLSSTLTNAGTLSDSFAEYVRIGSFMDVILSTSMTTNPSGTVIWTPPSSLTIDTTKLNTVSGTRTVLGYIYATDEGVQNYFGDVVYEPATSATGLIFRFSNGALSSGTPFSWGANDDWTARFSVPIAAWAGNGTVNLGPGAQVEYVFNSSATTASDTTSFGYGAAGFLIQNFAPAGTTGIAKRVQFQYPVQVGDQITLEVDSGTNGQEWSPASERLGAFYANDANTTFFNFIVAPVAGSTTQFTINFYSATGGGGSWTSINTWRWRLKKCTSSAPVGFGLANANDSGLIPGYSTLARIRGNTLAGYGSTNTAILRFTNVTTNTGSGLTYASSATLGDSFTCTVAGMYFFGYSAGFNTGANFGISLNSTQLTTSITSITAADRLISNATPAADVTYSTAVTVFLSVGDVVRFHADTNPIGAVPARASFTVQRIA